MLTNVQISLPAVPLAGDPLLARISGLSRLGYSVVHADLIAGNGLKRGYFVNKHSDGDRDFGTFEGRIAASSGQVTIEGTWKFTGGTGKLKGLTGGGSYKGRMTSAVEVENTWEGKYQIAAKTQAA